MNLKQSAKTPLTLVLLAMAVLFTFSAPAQAVLMTYDYTGNPFTVIDDPALGPNLTGSVQVDIPADFTGQVAQASIISWSMTAGTATLTPVNAVLVTSYIDFITGGVSTWEITAVDTISYSINIASVNYFGSGDFDVVRVGFVTYALQNTNYDNPGTWTRAPWSPPSPPPPSSSAPACWDWAF